MAEPTPPPEGPLPLEAIRNDELTRLARVLVDIRAARAPWSAIPISILALWRPNLPRVALLGTMYVTLLVLARREQQRYLTEGPTPGFVGLNAALVTAMQLVGLATTGGLDSPLLPILPMFSLGAAVLLGKGLVLQRILVIQWIGVVALALGQHFGLLDVLAPLSFPPGRDPVHIALGALALGALTAAAAAAGGQTRALFDQIQARTGDARQDLLDTHRQQSEDLASLSSAIAHELKNPLASVKGLASLLARDLPAGKPAERLAVLRREVDRMQGILEEFLTFSRPAPPSRSEEVPLGSLAAEVATLHEGVARERGVRVVAEGWATAKGDLRKTKQILINLVQNALDVAPPGSAVELRVDRQGGRAVAEVEDRGPGLAAEVVERLFQAGVTTKPTGSGLGLTIARSLARQMGGELTIGPRPGGGCRARLELEVG